MAPLSKKEISHAETCKEFLVEAHKALEEATSAVEKARYATELIHPSPAPVPDAGEREEVKIYQFKADGEGGHTLVEVGSSGPVETGEQEVRCPKCGTDTEMLMPGHYACCNEDCELHGRIPIAAPTEPDRVEDDPDSDGLNVEPFEIGGISYQCRYSTWEKLMFGYSGWAKTPPEESVLLTHITQLRERIAELEANNE